MKEAINTTEERCTANYVKKKLKGLRSQCLSEKIKVSK
jgi:hypothetical protein